MYPYCLAEEIQLSPFDLFMRLTVNNDEIKNLDSNMSFMVAK